MGKITPRLKSILVIIAFLGFTNFILSGTRVNFSEIIFTKILSEKFTSLLSPDVLPQADAPLEQRAQIRPVEIFEVAGIRSSLKSASTPVITVGEITHATCSGNSDGAVSISVSDGTAPYAYLWSNGQTTETMTGVPPGNYTVTVTDSDNASTVSPVIEVKVEDKINPIAIAKDISVQLDAGGQATITAENVDNGSSDACGIASLSLDKNSFNCSNVGPN
ncbi:MAG TPA: hypothetical protein VLN72_10020, partial [Gillisia sp.]|nr:hypothetical protein [Gillisia sp.]